jgi:HEAT repeat protein
MFSPDDRLGITLSNVSFHVWDVARAREAERPGRAAKRPLIHGFPLAISPDGAFAVSTDSRGVATALWRVDTGREVRELQEVRGARCFTFTTDSKSLLVGFGTGEIKRIDLSDGAVIQTLGKGRLLESTECMVTGMRCPSNGRPMLVSCYGRSLKSWDLQSGKELRTFDEPDKQAQLLALSSDGKKAISQRWWGSTAEPFYLCLWDVESGKEIRRIAAHERDVLAASFTSDDSGIVSAGKDGTLKRWEIATGNRLWSREVTMGAAAFSSDGRLALLADHLGAVQLWDAHEGRFLRLLAGRKEPNEQKNPRLLAELSKRLLSPDVQARREAAEDLGKAGSEAVPSLSAALNDADSIVRRNAVRSLEVYSFNRNDAETSLRRALARTDLVVAGAAAAIFYNRDHGDRESLAVLTKAMESPDASVRREALEVMHGNVPEAIPALCKAITDPEPSIRRAAAAALGSMVHSSARQKDLLEAALTGALGDADEEVRCEAVRALWLTKHLDALAALRDLRPLLQSPSVETRVQAVLVLKQVGDRSRVEIAPAVEDLTGRLGDQDARVRIEAAAILRKQGVPSVVIVPSLIQTLDDEDDLLVQRAVNELGSLGPEASGAVDPLIRAMKEKPAASVKAAEALARIGPAAVPALVKTVRDLNSPGRSDAVSALWHMGPGAEGAAPALVEAMKHLVGPSGLDERYYAAEALGRIGPGAAKVAVPALIAVAKDGRESPFYRQACLTALGAMGPAAADAIPALTELQNEAAVGPHALLALAKIKAGNR